MTLRRAPPLLLTVTLSSWSFFASSFSPLAGAGTAAHSLHLRDRHTHHRPPSRLAPPGYYCRASDADTDERATPVATTSTKYAPSTVIARDLTKSYPETLASRLFSSVPRREYALDLRGTTITLRGGLGGRRDADADADADLDEYDDGVTLLVGASASGKSTLLRLLAGLEGPTSGTVTINGVVSSGDDDEQRSDGRSRRRATTPRPVIVDSKPRFADDSRSVGEWIEKVGFDQYLATDRTGDELSRVVVAKVAEDLCSILGLTEGQRRGRPSDLSPSGEFLLAVACGCVESVAGTLTPPSRAGTTTTADGGIEMHRPIILLDELFDFEHPDVAGRAGRGLADLVRSGAVVVAATHVPQHLDGVSGRKITMSGGMILSDVRTRRRGAFNRVT